MSAYRAAAVYVRNTLAGVLRETEEGYSFVYDDAYLRTPHAAPVSLTLPLRQEPYTSKTLFSFFDGLIPEGWLLNLVTHNCKLRANDRFGLLLVACKDGSGSVVMREVSE